MKTMRFTLALAFLLAGLPLVAQDKIPEDKNHQDLIYKATAWMLCGIVREIQEKDGKEAMEQLKKDKDNVCACIIRELKDYKSSSPTKLNSFHYGTVLASFGEDYVKKLEPDVLNAPNEDSRTIGTLSLIQCKTPEPLRKTAIGLAVAVLKRDKSPKVQAAALTVLFGLNALEQSPLVLTFLSSEDARMRSTAILFYADNKVPEALPTLKERLALEKESSIVFLLAKTICNYEESSVLPFISHENPAVRHAALDQITASWDRQPPENRAALIKRLPLETDVCCRYKIAERLFYSKDPKCLGIFIELLNGKDDPMVISESAELKTAVSSILANILKLELSVTDKDRADARANGSCLYDRVANDYARWWKKYKEQVVWSKTENKFVILKDGKELAPWLDSK